MDGFRASADRRFEQASRRLAGAPAGLGAALRPPQPSRSAGGFRLYSNVDEARVQSMQRHLGAGLSAAEAARLALAETEVGGADRRDGPARLDQWSTDLGQRSTASTSRRRMRRSTASWRRSGFRRCSEMS